MIIIASVLGGSVIGYRTGADRRGTHLFLIVWVAVFVFQTALLLATSDDPRNRNTGAWELGTFRLRSPSLSSASQSFRVLGRCAGAWSGTASTQLDEPRLRSRWRAFLPSWGAAAPTWRLDEAPLPL